MRRTLNRLWLRRILVLIVVAAAVFGVMTVAGMNPQPMLLAALVGSAAALGWFAVDVLPEVESAYWQPGGRATGRQRGSDQRVHVIKRRLSDSFRRDRVAPDLRPLLTELTDEKLAAVHGVDRRTEPAQAAQLLGPELTAFMADSTDTSRDRLRSPAYVAVLLSRIEAL